MTKLWAAAILLSKQVTEGILLPGASSWSLKQGK